jgi:hypothetical protein
MPGFKTSVFNLNYDASQPSMYNFPLSVASTAETVTVEAQAAQMDTSVTAYRVVTKSGTNELAQNGRNYTELVSLAPGTVNQNQASANVLNLQKRVAGVLPVPVDVPRAGTSFSFVRPLVLDEETKVTFSYKSR